MPVFNNFKEIKSIYYDDKKIKAVYHNDLLIYQDQDTGEENNPYAGYNIFVFDTSKVANTTTVSLQNNRAGDTTEWDGLTDWGDGAINSELTHTYATDGIYTVKTKYIHNRNSGDNTKTMLVACDNINKNITNASSLFSGCANLKTVKILQAISKITDTSYMFADCSSLISLDSSLLKTRNVTDMTSMFRGCSSLEALKVAGFNTSNVTKMEGMFQSCKVDGSQFKNWNVSGVTSMSLMFYESIIVNCLDLSGWDVSNVDTMSGMFSSCSPEDGINISNWDIKYGINTAGMFYGVRTSDVIHDGVSSSDWDAMKKLY